MQGSTVVINPPDGDMAPTSPRSSRCYGEDLAVLAPGHGFLDGRAAAHASRRLMRHRLAREAKVRRRAARARSGEPRRLLPLVYDDVPARMHRVAERSLLAHLLQLAAEGRAFEREGRWSAAV